MGPETLQLVITLGVFAVVFLALMLDRYGPEVVMLAGLVVLVLCGILDLEEALVGFANPSVIAIGSLYIVGAGLRSTGGLESISLWMLGRPTAKTSLVRLLFPISTLSAFMNNTPLVAFFMPIFVQLAKRLRISPSRLLIPLSYAAILGGCCTLVGTSTNLVVDGVVRQQPTYVEDGVTKQQPPLGMFEIAWVGLPIAVVGMLYLVTIGRKLLPEREDLLEHLETHPREYTVEMLVLDICPLCDKTIREAGLRELPGLYLYRIERAGETISPVTPSTRIYARDLLCFSGIASTVVDLQKIRGLVPIEHRNSISGTTDDVASLDSLEGLPPPPDLELAAPRTGRQLCEAVISANSPLLGVSIRDANFRSRYNASVLAVHRSGERLQQKIGTIVVHTGDTLLIDAGDDFLRRWRHSAEFVLVSGVDDSAPVEHDRAWVALLVFFGVVLGMSFAPVSPVVVALVGAILMVLTGCVKGGEGNRSIELSVILLVGAALGIGRALESSGAADLLAKGLLDVCQEADHRVVLALLYLLTVVLSEFLSNNACAAMMASLAVAVAHQLGTDPRPYLISVAVASSCAFATPIGYQTNLMVLNAGGYKFTDYLKIGLPLNLICMIIAVLLIPLIWGV